MAEVNNNALLLFQVGPVLCCAPTQRVAAIIEPRPLTRPPGASPSQPGIFKHAGNIVTTRNLRYHFGVTQQNWKIPGRIIIATLAQGSSGFFVDEITAVISMPSTGWGTLPTLIPHSVFSRTLLLNEKMYLYTDFDKLDTLREQGCLRLYLQQLQAQQEKSSVPELPARAEATINMPSTRQPRQTVITVPVIAATTATIVPITTHTRAATTRPIRSVIDERRKAAAQPFIVTGQRDDKPIQKIMPTPQVAPSKPTRHTATQAETEFAVPSNRLLKNAALAGSSLNRTPSDAGSLLIDLDSGSHGVWPERRNGVEFRVVQQTAKQHTDKVTMAPPTHPPATQQNTRVLFAVIILALIGGMVSLFFISTTTTPSLSTNTKSVVIESGVTPSQPSPDNASIPDKVTTTPASINAAPYQATILKDNSGITIVLSAPTQEPVFTANEHAIPSVLTSVATTSTKALPQQTEIIHIVTKGDTLWHIAKQYVHNPFRYPELARLSNIKNPDLIYPGNRVRIIHRE